MSGQPKRYDHFPELELLYQFQEIPPENTLSPATILYMLVRLYERYPTAWMDGTIVSIHGFKKHDLWKHEGVMLKIRKGREQFYITMERDWSESKARNRASSSTDASSDNPPDATPGPSLTPPADRTTSSDGGQRRERESGKPNVVRVLSSKSVRARDGVELSRDMPLSNWSCTFHLSFAQGLPLIIGALVGSMIMDSKPVYRLFRTNCFFFAGLFRELVKKYAADNNVACKDEEKPFLGLAAEEDPESEQQYLRTAKSGIYRGIPIVSQKYLKKNLPKIYPVLQDKFKEFEEAVSSHILS